MGSLHKASFADAVEKSYANYGDFGETGGWGGDPR